jgi:hypothetical protein
MMEGFLLGLIVTSSFLAGAFFLKFWRKTRDLLFLGFATAFMIEGVNRLAFLFLDEPNEGAPLVYTVRLFSYLLILAAIIHKNRG